MESKKRKIRFLLLLIPIYIFTLVFVLFPIVYMIFLSFMTRAEVWGFVKELTFENYLKILNPQYLQMFKDSFVMAFTTTFFVVLFGYPFGYYMARLRPKWRNIMMILVMIPFWTSELIRLRGWTIFFSSNGVLDRILMFLQITKAPLKLMYSYPIVIFGMVYSLLPIMILAVYSGVEKMDWSLVEASRDLGATAVQAFFQVTFPMTLPGLLSGIVLTFVPSMGLFFVADILGGNKIVLVGSVIQQQLTKGRNLPFAAALSVVLMILTSLVIWFYRRMTKSDRLEGMI